MQIGLDRLVSDGFGTLRGQRLGILCNQSSVNREYRHVLDLMLEAGLAIAGVFGPEHGLHGHTQDNMIEWEGEPDPRTGLVVHSLYGQHREPTDAMLEGVEQFVVDIQDVGARYYTFVWTMSLCMKACERLRIPLTVLDRPNPIDGVTKEGCVLQPTYESFVGLHPLPLRHGMTIGEVARHLQRTVFPSLKLEVVGCSGWDRSLYLDDTDAPWAMPSPNMPTVDTAVVYPGGCLVEATNLSEGRGTTRPFEIVGAPYVDGWKLARALEAFDLEGVRFRPIQFEPTFNKHVGQLCEGVFVHVMDRRRFRPVATFAALLLAVRRLFPGHFAWKPAPYEYEYERLPIDILAGNSWFREAVDAQVGLDEIKSRMQDECEAFVSS